MKKIIILGAGPIGLAYAIQLARQGDNITIYERRSLKECTQTFGKSINLVITKKARDLFKSIDISESTKKISVPMQGRMIHDRFSDQSFFQQYGIPGQTLDSISRARLNYLMIEEAMKYESIDLTFHVGCNSIDTTTDVMELSNGMSITLSDYDLIIAADGAGSKIRTSLKNQGQIKSERTYLNYGYVETEIPSGNNKEYLMSEKYLHIWPLEKLMCIALPNPEGSFTGGVFAPINGSNSFESIADIGASKYFSENFPLVLESVPDFTDQYKSKTPSQLSEVRCDNWIYKNLIIVGDAAHAITPFLGQGMNFGLMLSQKLVGLLQTMPIPAALANFEKFAKPEAELIARWSLENFKEMCSSGDLAFQLRKKIERKLAETYPLQFACFHTMVSFCKLSYSTIETELERQDQQFEKLLKLPDIMSTWATSQWSKVEKLMLREDDDFYNIELPVSSMVESY